MRKTIVRKRRDVHRRRLPAQQGVSRQIYLHRWKDGTVSVVVANNPIDAAEQLNEVAQVDPGELIIAESFVATFYPTPPGDGEENPLWELESLGWNTEDEIERLCGSAADNLARAIESEKEQRLFLEELARERREAEDDPPS